MSKLEKSKDYKKFNLRKDNRKVTERQVLQLMESMEKHGFIAPLIVNSKMEVLDGQNRLEAAKRLKLEVEYKIHDGNGKMAELLSDLQISSKWAAADYLHYYVTHGRRDYVAFKRFIETNNIKLGIGISIAMSNSGGAALSVFKRGLLKFDKEKSLKILQDINEIRGSCRSFDDFADSDRFLKALIRIQQHKFFSKKKLLAKIKSNPGFIKPCGDCVSYISQFNALVNKGERWEKEINFLKK
jgi:hypothetical protein